MDVLLMVVTFSFFIIVTTNDNVVVAKQTTTVGPPITLSTTITTPMSPTSQSTTTTTTTTPSTATSSSQYSVTTHTTPLTSQSKIVSTSEVTSSTREITKLGTTTSSDKVASDTTAETKGITTRQTTAIRPKESTPSATFNTPTIVDISTNSDTTTNKGSTIATETTPDPDKTSTPAMGSKPTTIQSTITTTQLTSSETSPTVITAVTTEGTTFRKTYLSTTSGKTGTDATDSTQPKTTSTTDEGTNETPRETITTITNTTTERIGSPEQPRLPVWVYVTMAVSFAIIVALCVVLIILLMRFRRCKRTAYTPDKRDDVDLTTRKSNGSSNIYETQLIDTKNGRKNKLDTSDNVSIVDETRLAADDISKLNNASIDNEHSSPVHDVSGAINHGNIVKVNNHAKSFDHHRPSSGGQGIEVISIGCVKVPNSSNTGKCSSLYDINDEDHSNKEDEVPESSQEKPIEKIKGSKTDIDSAIKEFNKKQNQESQSTEKPLTTQSPNRSPAPEKPQASVPPKPVVLTSEKSKSESQNKPSKTELATMMNKETSIKLKGNRKSSLDEASLWLNAERQANETKGQRKSSLYDRRGSVDGLTVDCLQSTISNLKNIQSENGKSNKRDLNEAPDENVYENRTVHLMVNAIETGLRNANTNPKKQESDNQNETTEMHRSESKDIDLKSNGGAMSHTDNYLTNHSETAEGVHQPVDATKKKKSKKEGGSQSTFKSLYAIISKKLKGKTPLSKIGKSECEDLSQEYSYAYGQTDVQPSNNVYAYADVPSQNETPDDFYSEIPPLQSQMSKDRIPEAIYATADDKTTEHEQSDDMYSLEQTPKSSVNNGPSRESMNDVYSLETNPSEQQQNSFGKQVSKLETISETDNQDEEDKNNKPEMIVNDIYNGQSGLNENKPESRPDINIFEIKDNGCKKSIDFPEMPSKRISSNTKYHTLKSREDDSGCSGHPTSSKFRLDGSLGKPPERQNKVGQDTELTSEKDNSLPAKFKNVCMIENDLYSNSESLNDDEIDLVCNDLYEKGPATAL